MEMQETTGQQNSYSNYQKMGDDDSTSWYILSIISWILFAISMWVSYFYEVFIWSPYQSLYFGYMSSSYFPIEIKLGFPYLYIYFFLISVIGFSVYLVFTTCKKNHGLYDGMLGNISKFHCIPLLLISALYIISRSSEFLLDDDMKSFRTLIIFDLIFTIIALICLIGIYIKTELNTEWYIVLSIKKGVFSSFIILLLYNFFHIIPSFRAINGYLKYEEGDYNQRDKVRKSMKACGIAFSILLGPLCLVFSFIFKDLAATFTTFLLYLGMVITFFTKNKSQREYRKKYYNGVTDGVFDIIYMLLSLVLIAFLVLKYRSNLF